MAKETLGATVSVFLLLGGIEAALYTYGTSVSLHKTLLQNYSKDIRPVTNQTKTLLIDIKLNIKAINKFDETEGVLHTVFGLTLEWTDELIQWNPTDYGQASIVRLPKSKVWIPSLFLVNSATSLEIELGNDKTQTVTYQANGSALCSTGIITSSMCSPNIMYYPFDNHDCSVQFSNLVSSKEISLRIDRRISTDVYEPNTIWELESVSGENFLRQGASLAEARIKIKRRPTFLLINIFAPILFLAMVNLLVFAIPIASGERISFAVTILLSFAVFLTLVTDKMPQTSLTVSLFSIYLILTMTNSSLIMVSLVFILEMYYTEKEETAGKVTRFLISVLERVTNNPRNNKVVGETELHKGKGKSEEADELPEDLTQSSHVSASVLVVCLSSSDDMKFLTFPALLTASFLYVVHGADATLLDWSDPATWPNGKIMRKVRLDVFPPELQGIEISAGGSLVWGKNSSEEINPRVHYVLIKAGGKIVIGSEDCNYVYKTTITLLGNQGDLSIPGFGEKFIGVEAGGTLELHGEGKLSWTKLQGTIKGFSAISSSFRHKDQSDNKKWDGVYMYHFKSDGTFVKRLFRGAKYIVAKALMNFVTSVPDSDSIAMATQGDLDKTAKSKIYSVVDALDTANEVRKHQPDGAYVFAAKKGATNNL
eukprot:XP_019924033.1 PREDICTED: neuronal acetylcholine receptor subunit alpha-4-like [Crassostrea gigas]